MHPGAFALYIAEKQLRVDRLIDIPAVVNGHERLRDEILIPGDENYLDPGAQRADKLSDIHAALVADGNIEKGEVEFSVCVLGRKLLGQLGGAVYADKLNIGISVRDYFGYLLDHCGLIVAYENTHSETSLSL